MPLSFFHLPPLIVNQGFIKHDPRCNYELYLTELLNTSAWFIDRYSGFVHTKKQSNHECDAYSTDGQNYGIDFKLVAGQSYLRASKLVADHRWRREDGAIIIGESKSKSEEYNSLVALLNRVSYQDIDGIIQDNTNKKTPKNDRNADIYSIIKSFETPKNLLLFLPIMFFEENKSQSNCISEIAQKICADYEKPLFYRLNTVPGFDTYFTALFNRQFLIYKYENQALIICDTISIERVKLFNKLYDEALFC